MGNAARAACFVCCPWGAGTAAASARRAVPGRDEGTNVGGLRLRKEKTDSFPRSFPPGVSASVGQRFGRRQMCETEVRIRRESGSSVGSSWNHGACVAFLTRFGMYPERRGGGENDETRGFLACFSLRQISVPWSREEAAAFLQWCEVCLLLEMLLTLFLKSVPDALVCSRCFIYVMRRGGGGGGGGGGVLGVLCPSCSRFG